MEPVTSLQRRRKLFLWIALGCIALAIGYTSWVILRGDIQAAQPEGDALPVAGAEELAALQTGPHLIFLHQAGPHYGQVAVARLDPELSQSMGTSLKCDRVYYAAGSGLCLVYDTSNAAQDPMAAIPVWVTLFGSDFQPRHKFTVEGIPSRTRVSPDGKYAAFTVFVSGHSYADTNMSTATMLLDTATGESLGNLEEFEVWKDGQRFQAPEFNFWGVTFAQDSNRFYATLRNGSTTYLLDGDVAARKLTVLHENVECPSLSPDGTRVAFKKLTPTGLWQLTVLDLATMKETSLAEKESIDDQVEWL
ncbi:MAG TPA: hypothetical protein VHP14_17380, partial [Anaerolineales bacterium]|nr:hypothetical protein [Anaerolineales bacterium]